jgi:hypothetical protein
MYIADKTKYLKYRETSELWDSSKSFIIKLALPMLLFACLGGVTWAIRGTGGWDGIQGTILPGLTWGILWYYLSYRRGIDSRSLILWLGLGLAIGGELGYGQYIAWIMGKFEVIIEIPVADVAKENSYLEISPFFGYLWLIICGIGWTGIGSILVGWVLNTRVSFPKWIFRLIIPFGFVGLGSLLLDYFPSLFFPHYSPELYLPQNCTECERTIFTNTQNFLVVMWWLGAIVTAYFQKDKHTLVSGLVLGIGFGIAFSVTSPWCLGYMYAPGYIDWWKMWEGSHGFLLGGLYAIVWYWANKDIDNTYDSKENLSQILDEIADPTPFKELIRKILLLVSVAFLLFMSIHGGSLNIGDFLGLYDVNLIDQYDWPFERLVVFVPITALIIVFSFYKIWQYVKEYRSGDTKYFNVPYLHEKISYLILVMGVLGAVTIWPTKIGVIYAILISFAIWSMNRLNIHYNNCIEEK